MSVTTWTRRYAGWLALAALAAACGSTATPASPQVPGTTAPPTAVRPTSTATTVAPPVTAMGRRCGPPDVEATAGTVTGPNGELLWTGAVGSGGTVAVLLHQTDRTASCGWWPFANQLAAHGVRAVMLDFCGYGQSRCDPAKPWTTDYVDQATRAVAQARAEGATRVTLVGASLGGTVATLSAGRSGADAVVNLSGFGFGSLVTAPALAALTVPVLGAGSRTEETESLALEAQVAAAPSPTKRFVWDTAGHGWSLVLVGPQPDSPLTDVGRTVIAWTKGDYAG